MLVSTHIVRKVDELGRIVIPMETRKTFDIQEKDELEIFLDVENGQIILQKMGRLCLQCRSPKNTREIKLGYYICDKCIEELSKM